MKKKKLIIIGGPTASGKTGTAIAVAQHFDIPILSCDSRQFYRELNIGTAKPTADELASAPHHFINNLSIHDDYSVGQYEREAMACLEQIYLSKDSAILTGGTGLYIRAVCEGLDDFPDVSSVIQEDIQNLFDTKGIVPLQEELKTKDPIYYEQVDIQNPHRLIRALGIIRATGQPFSSFRTKVKKNRPFDTIYIYMDWDRTVLYQRINQRVDMMLQAGLLEEVRALYPYKHLNALQTVGYQEFFDYFDQKHDLDTAIELVKRNTRRYAKRQLTWLRKDAHWQGFHPSHVATILEYLSERL